MLDFSDCAVPNGQSEIEFLRSITFSHHLYFHLNTLPLLKSLNPKIDLKPKKPLKSGLLSQMEQKFCC